MTDNVRRFCAIHKAKTKYYPGTAWDNFARHLLMLAALMTGIVGSRRINLPEIASKAPDLTKAESRVKRYCRFLKNERVTDEGFFLPFIKDLFESLSKQSHPHLSKS